MSPELYHGWSIRFQKNIHMYCHNLTAEKENRSYSIPCEDSPVFKGIVMWPYELNLESDLLQDLVTALLKWATSSNLECLIYTSKTNYMTNAQQF
ncbi:hypothetical protein [Gimesia panareensis]|uniref:hypothetical protein n=1 Tax=Gimesia panareensis TaxID=2527978 RepID=UPI00118D3F5D|nr:hypothetical protein [Gimesia panareensis]QDU51252.1 hypothetical protein Pan110_36160 [Gimesia panareensis]